MGGGMCLMVVVQRCSSIWLVVDDRYRPVAHSIQHTCSDAQGLRAVWAENLERQVKWLLGGRRKIVCAHVEVEGQYPYAAHQASTAFEVCTCTRARDQSASRPIWRTQAGTAGSPGLDPGSRAARHRCPRRRWCSSACSVTTWD
jgi:hypothetical protein